MAQSTVSRGPVTGTATRSPSKAPFLVDFYRTALGKKWVMAVSGILGMLFVFGHMVGNLKMYQGAEAFDHYAEFLRELLYPILPRTVALWLLRFGLIAALLVHVLSAAQLTRQNMKARGVKYQSPRDYVAANWASRSMRVTGIIIFLYIPWHLADLTWGMTGADWTRGEVYDNVVESLSRPWNAAIYLVVAVAVAVHLYHGAWSIFQTMGWNNPRFNPWRRWFAVAFAGVMLVGNLSFPIAVLTGIVG
jgi:succinate dehydrogenase / fumarate reductase, cytochrome b subunit